MTRGGMRCLVLLATLAIVAAQKPRCPEGAGFCYNARGIERINKLRAMSGSKPLTLGSLAMTLDAMNHSEKMNMKNELIDTSRSKLQEINNSGKYKCDEFLLVQMVTQARVRPYLGPSAACINRWEDSEKHKNVLLFPRADNAAFGVKVNGTLAWCTLILSVNTRHNCEKPVWSESPSPTPTLSVTPSSTMTATATATASATPTPTISVTPSSTMTATATATASATPSPTISYSASPAASMSPSPSAPKKPELKLQTIVDGTTSKATATETTTPTKTVTPSMTASISAAASPKMTSTPSTSMVNTTMQASVASMANTTMQTASASPSKAEPQLIAQSLFGNNNALNSAQLGIPGLEFSRTSPQVMEASKYTFKYGRVNIKYETGLVEATRLQCFGGVCRYCVEGGTYCYSANFSMLVDVYLKRNQKA